MSGWLYDDDWRNYANCRVMVANAYPGDRRYVANMWWPIRTHDRGKTLVTADVEEALRICNGSTGRAPCPVRTECLMAGMTEKEGLWGGQLPEERRRLRRRIQRARLKKEKAV